MTILHVSRQVLESLSKLDCHFEDQGSESDLDHVTNARGSRVLQAELKSCYLGQQLYIF